MKIFTLKMLYEDFVPLSNAFTITKVAQNGNTENKQNNDNHNTKNIMHIEFFPFYSFLNINFFE